MSDYAFRLRVTLSNRRPVVIPPTRRRAASLQERLARQTALDWNRSCAAVVITAYDDLVPQWDSAGRVRLAVEVKHGRAVIFPRGQLTCALHGASDGIAAKELVMGLVAMSPLDGSGVEPEYFADYTPEQLAWVTAHGEAIDMERQDRYCDPETGEVRRTA